MGNGSATCLWHQRLEFNNLTFDPLRFWLAEMDTLPDMVPTTIAVCFFAKKDRPKLEVVPPKYKDAQNHYFPLPFRVKVSIQYCTICGSCKTKREAPQANK